MKKNYFMVLAIAVLWSTHVFAQDISGDWQATLNVGGGNQLRTVLTISKSDSAGWKGMFYSIDQGPEGVPIPVITLQDSVLKFSLNEIHGSYEGKLSADGGSITGAWHQGQSWPLDFKRATKDTAWKIDPSPHTVRSVSVEQDVQLEVLDWGGTGRPLILLAGLGNTAHIFDQFAPKLTASYHVYGITRRGFGTSTAPKPDWMNYRADRLGDDVLAVIDALKIQRPVLAGHSIAGEELSSIGSRFPERVAGLIYLDAGYDYAYYNDHASVGDPTADSAELRQEINQLLAPQAMREHKAAIKHVLETTLPRLEKDFQNMQEPLADRPDSEPAPANGQSLRIGGAIEGGEQIYRGVQCPVLAIFAVPHHVGPMNPADEAKRPAMEARDLVRTTEQAAAFEAGNPSAHVVRLPHADHYVFVSNEADVLREMNIFLAKLP